MSASDDEQKCDNGREGDVADELGNMNGEVQNTVRNRHWKGKGKEKL